MFLKLHPSAPVLRQSPCRLCHADTIDLERLRSGGALPGRVPDAAACLLARCELHVSCWAAGKGRAGSPRNMQSMHMRLG